MGKKLAVVVTGATGQQRGVPGVKAIRLHDLPSWMRVLKSARAEVAS